MTADHISALLGANRGARQAVIDFACNGETIERRGGQISRVFGWPSDVPFTSASTNEMTPSPFYRRGPPPSHTHRTGAGRHHARPARTKTTRTNTSSRISSVRPLGMKTIARFEVRGIPAAIRLTARRQLAPIRIARIVWIITSK